MNYFFYLYPLKMNTQRTISAIVTDRKLPQPDGNGGIEYYRPNACVENSRGMVSMSNYYPDVHTERSRNGMGMDERSFISPDYRQGFPESFREAWRRMMNLPTLHHIMILELGFMIVGWGDF